MEYKYTYYVYDKEIPLKSMEAAFLLLDKLEEKFKDLFFSGFSAYEDKECPIFLRSNETNLMPLYSDSLRVRLAQKREWKRNQNRSNLRKH